MSTTYTVGVRIEGSAAGLARASKEAQAHVKQMGAGMSQEFSKMARAREVLGVRPEREIQREIYKTEAAYNRLTRSGTLSFNDQRRAAKAMRDEVTKLTNEMGRLTTKQKVMRGLAIGGGVAAAGAVAGAFIAPKVRTAMAYDLRLAHLANTGYSDKDKAGRAAGRSDMDAKVVDAVKYGGGTRDSALDSLEMLIGSGIFKPKQIDSILREAQLAATANNADPAAFSQIAISANQTMGITPEQMGRIFGMGTFAGQSGGFEIKDMAKWLPQQMAAAKAVGMYGERGFAKLAALNQASVVTAGTKDEAGNNVVNLMAKMGSQDTAKDFKKMGINLPQKLAEGRMKGLDALDVVGGLLQEQLGKDKNFQRVQKELAAAKNDGERTQALTAVGDIAQGTVIGKVFQDRQALMALYAYMNARERVNTIAKDSFDNPDAQHKNMALIKDTASFKADQLANTRAAATQATMDKMLPAIGAMADGLTGVVEKYPGYTTAITAAAVAVTGLAGAAGLAALALRGGAPSSGGPSLPGPSGTGPAAASSAGRFARFAGMAGKLAGPLGFLMMLEGISPEEIERLKAYEARKAHDDGGGRGKGFNDPRLIGSGANATTRETVEAAQAQTGPFNAGVAVLSTPARGKGFNDPRLIGSGANTGAFEQSLRTTDVKGEIFVRVSAAPGLNVQVDTKSNSRGVQIRSDLGMTMTGAGY